MKKRIRTTVDIAMVILLPMLMAYSLIGEKFHEIAGLLMFALFVAHHILNFRWFKALFKGKYTAKRTFQTVLNLLLLIYMILQPLSGILMSKHLFAFLKIPGVSAAAREMHLLLAYWGFVLLCLHAGTHLTAPLGRLKSKKKGAWAAVVAVLCAVSAYGIYAFIKRQIAEYMFLKSAFVFFDFSEPRVYFFLDYAAVMILFATAGYWIVLALTKTERKGEKDESITD